MCYTVCDIELDRTRGARLSHTEVSPSGETSGGAACGGVTWRQIERGILVCHTPCSLRRGDIESERTRGARLSHTVRLADGDVETDRTRSTRLSHTVQLAAR